MRSSQAWSRSSWNRFLGRMCDKDQTRGSTGALAFVSLLGPKKVNKESMKLSCKASLHHNSAWPTATRTTRLALGLNAESWEHSSVPIRTVGSGNGAHPGLGYLRH